MGCSQSTVKDQVHDTTPDAAPAVVVDTVVVAESAPETEEAAVVVATEEVVAPVEEAAAAVPVEEAAPVETPVEEVAAVEPEVAAPVAPVEEAVVAVPVEEVAVVDEVTAVVEKVVAAPVEEAAPVPEVAAEMPAAVVEVAVVEEVAVEAEPETEAAPAVDETKASGLVFVSAGVTFGDKSVAFYNFNATNAEDPAQDVKISKRFNDFKTLHAEIANIMANEANVTTEHQDKFQTYPALPALPKTSFFRGRSNKKQTEDREAQFLKILNAVAQHPIAAESQKFKAFLA